MADAKLTISRGQQQRSVALDPKGIVLGRSPACDVVLDSGRVSRRHARIFRDPFGRWIVEDLGSRHGVWIGQERVEAAAVLPGERLLMGPYALVLAEETAQQIAADPSVTTTTTVLEDRETAEVVPAAEALGPLDQAQVRRLNAITDRLAGLTSPGELYPEACRLLAAESRGVAVAVRLPAAPQALSPEILACDLGAGRPAGPLPGRVNLHLSRRALEAVRTQARPVTASNLPHLDADVGLTVVDQLQPRVVLCAPVAEAGETMDALYLDLPSAQEAVMDLDFVRAVAHEVSLVGRSLLLSEAKAERRVLDHQLRLAREIQSNLIPREPGPIGGIDVAVFYSPAMWVGGDYGDTWLLADGRLAFAIGDVCGKGLSAALLMSNLQAGLRATTPFCCEPADIMTHVSKLLNRSLPEGMFVTLFLGLFDPAAGRLEYVNAGHIPPTVVVPGAAPRPLAGRGNMPVGVHEGAFAADAETIAPGSGLLVVTDGITEAASPGGEQFGMARLERVVAAAQLESAEALVKSVTAAAEGFRESLPQQDDVTVFALIHRAGGARA